MALTWSEEIRTAHDLGATFANGYWKFPTPEVAAQFKRIQSGLEWSPKQAAQAQAALVKQRDEFVKKQSAAAPMEPSE